MVAMRLPTNVTLKKTCHTEMNVPQFSIIKCQPPLSDLFRDHGYQYNIFFGLYIDIGGCWNRWKFFNHRGVLLQCQKVI